MALVGLTLLSPRQELPYHLEQLLDNNRLTRCLLEWEVFGRLFNEDFSIDLLRSWQKVKEAAIIESITKVKFLFFDATTILLFALRRFLFQTANNYHLSAVGFRFLSSNQFEREQYVTTIHLVARQHRCLNRGLTQLPPGGIWAESFWTNYKKHVARIPCTCSWVPISSGSQISSFSLACNMFCNVCCLIGWWIRHGLRSL